MKKIVFCLQTMVLGGVEKELITVLKQIHGEYDITLLLLYLDDTEMLSEIPSNVRILNLAIETNYYCTNTAAAIKQRLKRGKFAEAFSLAIKKCFKRGMTTANTDISDIPEVNDLFDVAICYHVHSPLMLRYAVEKIRANKTVAWIHNDFFCSGYPIQRLKKFVQQYDEFVAVSKKVENEFRLLCPWYGGDVSTAYNYLDAKEIVELSYKTIDESDYLNENQIRVLTVGRFTEQKAIDIAISAAEMLKKNHVEFHWFVLGYGPLENAYRKLIEEKNVADCFTILGKKTNPYPYIRLCDIYVQPSRHEAFGLVVTEAKILRRPIICTDFDGADEQIENDVNGIIVPVNDAKALCERLAQLICSPEKRTALTQELEKWKPEDNLREIVKHFD